MFNVNLKKKYFINRKTYSLARQHGNHSLKKFKHENCFKLQKVNNLDIVLLTK